MNINPLTIPETVQAYIHGEITEQEFLDKMRIARRLVDLYNQLTCLSPDKDKK